MFSQSPEEKLQYLLKQEWGLQLLNKKIQELSVAYQKKKNPKTLLALTTAMGQVNDICAAVIDLHKDNVVSMQKMDMDTDEEGEQKKGSSQGLQALSQAPEAVFKQYANNLRSIKAMPDQEKNPTKKAALKKLVTQLLPKRLDSKRSLVSGDQDALDSSAARRSLFPNPFRLGGRPGPPRPK